MTISFQRIAFAQEDEEYKGAEFCMTCHPSQLDKWYDSGHSEAYSKEGFQDTWSELKSPDECLECHTTGYDARTDTYESLEVTCEECHGPGLKMEVDSSPETCGKCHSGPYPTYEEWSESGPSHGNAECVTCHDQHTGTLTYDTSVETCGQCHDSHVEESIDSIHGESGVECSDCHMVVEEADFIQGIDAQTGHSFNPREDELDCTSCHDRPLDKHDILGEGAGACLSCHGDIHALRLELVNGEKYDNNNSVQLCAQCHNERYSAWAEGTHGAHDDPMADCSECHDPHNPIINQISTLEPIASREMARPASLVYQVAYFGIIGALAIAVYVLRRRSNV